MEECESQPVSLAIGIGLEEAANVLSMCDQHLFILLLFALGRTVLSIH